MATESKAWERMTERGESPEAYRSFVIYRDLGPGRCLESAYAKRKADGAGEGGQRAAKKPSGGFFRNAAKFEWVKRSDAWDDHRQKIRDRVAARYAAKWERRKQEAAEEFWSISCEFKKQLDKMLAIPLTTSKIKKDGKTLVITPAKWNYQTMILLAKTVGELKTAAINATTRPLGEYGDHELKAIQDAMDAASIDEEGGQ